MASMAAFRARQLEKPYSRGHQKLRVGKLSAGAVRPEFSQALLGLLAQMFQRRLSRKR